MEIILPNTSNFLYDFYTGQKINNQWREEQSKIKKMKILGIGGIILPWLDIVNLSVDFTLKSPISLMVFLNQNNCAQGTLYLDDGDSFEYENNNFLYLHYTMEENILKGKIQSKQTTKQYFDVIKNSHRNLENIYVYGLDYSQMEKIKCITLSYDEPDGKKTSDLVIKYEFNENSLTITDIYISIDTEFVIAFNY